MQSVCCVVLIEWNEDMDDEQALFIHSSTRLFDPKGRRRHDLTCRHHHTIHPHTRVQITHRLGMGLRFRSVGCT